MAGPVVGKFLSLQQKPVMMALPPAVLTAIIVPSVLMPNYDFDISLSNSPLIASLIAILIAWRTKNLLLTIIIGMVALWLMLWLLVFT